MSPAEFVAIFFGRAATTVRARYGDSAYIDMSGPDISIRNGGGLLGTGQTLRDAMREAAKCISDADVDDVRP